MTDREIAENIARDASCAQGEFHARVNAIIPYLSEIQRLQDALSMIANQMLSTENGEDGDYEFGYDCVIKIARSTLMRPLCEGR